jgi:valacyclovir hydrolase
VTWFNWGATRIYYEEHGSGDPVLIMPGFAGSIADVAHLTQALAPSYRVIAADLPGSGRSEPQPRAYPATFYEDDARTFIALLEHMEAGPTHLMGFSDGGEVSLVMAGVKPEIARSVVTWGAMGFLDTSQLQTLAAFESVVDRPIDSLRRFSEYLKATYGEDNARTMTQSFVKATRAIIEAGGSVGRAHAGEIVCPVLLVVGEEDFFAPPALVSQLASAISTAKIIQLSGAGHDVHRSHAEWLSETILSWLTTH